MAARRTIRTGNTDRTVNLTPEPAPHVPAVQAPKPAPAIQAKPSVSQSLRELVESSIKNSSIKPKNKSYGQWVDRSYGGVSVDEYNEAVRKYQSDARKWAVPQHQQGVSINGHPVQPSPQIGSFPTFDKLTDMLWQHTLPLPVIKIEVDPGAAPTDVLHLSDGTPICVFSYDYDPENNPNQE